jgi:hypothetical protein
MNMNIFCADLGSVMRGNFGWFGRLSDGSSVSGNDIGELAATVADLLNHRQAVALGFEAPMFVPLRDDPVEMTRCRKGETNANRIGGPGSAVLATGLAQVPWILREIRSRLEVAGSATMNWRAFSAGDGGLFLWEAFVSGSAKGEDHVQDARIAVNAFENALPDLEEKNAISEPTVMCLLGAAPLRTGWTEDVGLLAEACIVIKA